MRGFVRFVENKNFRAFTKKCNIEIQSLWLCHWAYLKLRQKPSDYFYLLILRIEECKNIINHSPLMMLRAARWIGPSDDRFVGFCCRKDLRSVGSWILNSWTFLLSIMEASPLLSFASIMYWLFDSYDYPRFWFLLFGFAYWWTTCFNSGTSMLWYNRFFVSFSLWD